MNTVYETDPDLVGTFHLVHEEVDDAGNPTGRRVGFAGVEFTPLGYADLLNAKLHKNLTLSLSWDHARVVESSVPELEIGKYASAANAKMESRYTSKTIGLIKGGWLPAGLGVQRGMIVMPDICTISDIKGRFHNGVKANEDDKDFLDFFSWGGVRINPSLYALEGSQGRNPDPEHVELRIREAISAIRSALPRAEVVPSDLGGLQGVVGLVSDSLETMRREQEFLMHMAPKIAAPASAQKRAPFWDEALAAAQEHGVHRHSLVVLAVLSAICATNGVSPAKRLLKPAHNYSAKVAYNALADLRSLRVLIGLLAIFPSEKVMLCTADKNLALFWTGLRASKFMMVGKAIRYTFSPVPELLTAPTPAQSASYFQED